MKLVEIAARITAHLKRFAADPTINKPYDGRRGGLTPYYQPAAWSGGGLVGIRYVGYQGHTNLRRADAERYLAWLDAGNVGKHTAIPPPEDGR